MSRMGNEHWNKMVTSFKTESDRSAGILCASFLEAQIKDRIIDFFADDKTSNQLFYNNGPLSTFSNLIDMLFFLGFLTKDMRSDLTLIRKVRNYFAHHPEHTRFQDRPIVDWCKELTTSKGIAIVNGPPLKFDDPKDQFLYAVAFTKVYVDRFIEVREKCTIPHSPLER